MGSSDQDAAPSLLQDLKVTMHNSSMVLQSKQTERKSLFLSNIDKVLAFEVETVHFFGSHTDFPPHVVTEKCKNALADALVAYEFLGGRLKLNVESGSLEMDCNGEGARFVVASSEYTLEEIGELDYPNPAFAQLVPKNKDFLKQGDLPLCVAPVTSFECGRFVIGFSTSHTTFDGLSFKTFLDNFAALAAKKPLAVIALHDRLLLAARSAPRVTFSHPELLDLGDLPTGHESSVFEDSTQQLDFKVFKLTSNDIAKLKENAKANASSYGNNKE